MARPKVDPQSGLFDHEIEDPEFEDALLNHIKETETRARLASIARRIEEGKERHDIKSMEDGARVRVGSVTFVTKARSGGGFPMPKWDTIGIGNIAEEGSES